MPSLTVSHRRSRFWSQMCKKWGVRGDQKTYSGNHANTHLRAVSLLYLTVI